MADNLQPDLPLRSPVAEAATANKTGIVMPPDVEDATSALDKQFEEVMGRQPSTADNVPDRDRDKAATEPESATEIPEDDSALDPAEAQRLAKLEADRKAAEEEAKRKQEEEAGKQTTEPKAEDDLLKKLLDPEASKAADTKPADTKPADTKPEDDPYKDHKLRADASDRTKSTFEDLKRTAREREAQVKAEVEKARKEAEELKKQVEELSKKTSTVPDTVEQELKELREFRATFDAERDPEFNKRFNDRREQNNATIFETLQRNGLKPLVVEQVQKLPYDQQVDQISRWADKLPPRDKLAVMSRLTDNETLENERSAALAEVKAKAAEILAQKQTAPEKNREAFVQEAVATLKPIVPQLPWLHPKEIPANASPKDKAELEKHNTAAAEAQRMLLGFLNDESPRSRSLLALAGVLAPRYRAELQQVKTELEAARKELNSIKEAGRLSKTARSSGTAAAAAPKVDIFETSAEDAMEQAWKQMSGE